MKLLCYSTLAALAVLVGLSGSIGSFREGTFAQAQECTVTVQPGESIQAAIDQAQEGAVICLSAGIWEENLKIEKKSLVLRGAGAEETVIDGVEEGYPVVWIMGPEEAQTASVKVERLSITGAKGWCADWDKGVCAYGMLIQGATRVEITDSTISENWGEGIWLRGSSQAEITRSTISGNLGDGIELSDLSQAEITGSTISENSGDGIEVSGSSLVEITSSIIFKNEWAGVLLGDSAQAEITDSIISGNLGRDSIKLWDLARVKIMGSTISENRGGISLRGSARIVIIDSAISKNIEAGVILFGSARAEITGSIISENWGGIMLEGSARAEITDSVIFGNDEDGIVLRGSARAIIEGNEIIDNGSYGVALFQPPCFPFDEVFEGHVSGKENTIPGPDEPNGNKKGAVCPSPELDFLMTEEGGEYRGG